MTGCIFRVPPLFVTSRQKPKTPGLAQFPPLTASGRAPTRRGAFMSGLAAEAAAAGGLNALDALAQIASENNLASPAKPAAPPNACSVHTTDLVSPAEAEGKVLAEIRCVVQAVDHSNLATVRMRRGHACSRVILTRNSYVPGRSNWARRRGVTTRYQPLRGPPPRIPSRVGAKPPHRASVGKSAVRKLLRADVSEPSRFDYGGKECSGASLIVAAAEPPLAGRSHVCASDPDGDDAPSDGGATESTAASGGRVGERGAGL